MSYPQADKLVAICKALDISLVDLLCDEEDKNNSVLTADYVVEENTLIENFLGNTMRLLKQQKKYILDQIFQMSSLIQNIQSYKGG